MNCIEDGWMRKVGIMSMQRIANYGSFLQAYSVSALRRDRLVCVVCWRRCLLGSPGADHRVLRFSLWPACRGRVADLQAGRAQLLFEMLYHGLITLGHFVPKQRGGGYA